MKFYSKRVRFHSKKFRQYTIRSKTIEICWADKCRTVNPRTAFTRSPTDLDDDAVFWICVADLNADYIDMPFGRGGPGTPGMPGSNSRTKRMRTSFKHHQLRTMKSYFAINHNPDAKDLKQLSQKTGLPKRVLQVNGDLTFGSRDSQFRVFSRRRLKRDVETGISSFPFR